jgi:hypothetical protein
LGSALRPELVDRLRDHAEFQGARYECAIAAAFIRCGFSIAWASGPGPKCEFVATQRLTGESIAVEVKSRRRPGTFNQAGEVPDRASLKFDVEHLYKRALKQCPNDKPFGIFIDVNLPPEIGWEQPGIPWEEEMKAMMSKFPESV